MVIRILVDSVDNFRKVLKDFNSRNKVNIIFAHSYAEEEASIFFIDINISEEDLSLLFELGGDYWNFEYLNCNTS